MSDTTNESECLHKYCRLSHPHDGPAELHAPDVIEKAEAAYGVYGEAVGYKSVHGEPLKSFADLPVVVTRGWCSVAEMISGVLTVADKRRKFVVKCTKASDGITVQGIINMHGMTWSGKAASSRGMAFMATQAIMTACPDLERDEIKLEFDWV